MKVAIFMMFQESEISGTLSSIKMLIPQLNEKVNLFLLGNGVSDCHKETFLDLSCDFLNLYFVDINLGVAGGRNFLLSKIENSFLPDFFVSLDNDIVVPGDYIKILVNSYNNLKNDLEHSEKKIGVISPLVLQASEISGFDHEGYKYPNSKDLQLKVKELYFRDGKKEVIYHAGIKNWRRHYFVNPGFIIFFKKVFSIFIASLVSKVFKVDFILNSQVTFLAHDEAFVKDILNKMRPRFVDTLPGGLHCFSREFLLEVGNYDERFNPFGYEDADLCIRGIRNNYKNIILPHIQVLHDIDRRYVDRPYLDKLKIYARCKKILMLKYINNPLVLIFRYFDFLFFYPLVVATHLKHNNERLTFKYLKVFWRNIL